MASSTSPLSTWPRLPEPDTSPASILFSAISFWADGAAGMSDPPLAGAAGASALAAGASLFASVLVSALAGAAAPSPSAICASSALTSTVSPSLARISLRVPETGEGTSIETLSVSSSTSGSSTFTVSPTFLSQVPMVASLTDSPRVGTRTSVAMIFVSVLFQSVRQLFGNAGGLSRPAHPRGRLQVVQGAATSGRSPSRPKPDGRCSGRAGTWHRYAPAPIPDRDR
jgi:hypothetical protein